MDDVWKLLAVLLAGFAGYIAYQQFRLGREKFKLDLFEKRFSVFAATRKLLSIILTEANVSLEQLFEYRAAVAEATFLFESDITGYLEEIDKKAFRFRFTNEQMRIVPVVENRDKVVEENYVILGWLTDQLPLLKLKFAPYLKFHVWS
ncbi:MAG: hypothetical protein WBM28_16765 [Burkholderiales bacterium]